MGILYRIQALSSHSIIINYQFFCSQIAWLMVLNTKSVSNDNNFVSSMSKKILRLKTVGGVKLLDMILSGLNI